MAAITNTNTATVRYSVSIAGKTYVVPEGSYSGPFVQEIEEVIPAGGSKTFTIAVDVSKIQLVVASADQVVAVKVNSASTPTPEVDLSATAGYLWGADDAKVNLLNVDITELFVSNPGTTDAKFHFGVITAA